jgi:hypothetical protein
MAGAQSRSHNHSLVPEGERETGGMHPARVTFATCFQIFSNILEKSKACCVMLLEVLST